MQIIWNNPAPITSTQVDLLLRELKTWHISTVQTLLRRLVTRGFLSTEKSGKERLYTPLVSLNEYICMEAEVFMEKFHMNTLHGLMRAMYSGKKLSPEDIAEFEQWLKDKEE